MQKPTDTGINRTGIATSLAQEESHVFRVRGWITTALYGEAGAAPADLGTG